jgi:hypothetical protein
MLGQGSAVPNKQKMAAGMPTIDGGHDKPIQTTTQKK